MRDTVNSVAADLGAIDVLVNNAGVGSMSLAVDADLDEWHTMVDVNLHGVLHSSHAALPHLVEAAKVRAASRT